MKVNGPSDYWRDVFRQELIESGGESTFSDYLLSEEVSRFRFYLDTLEQFIESKEIAETEMLKRQTHSLSEEQRGAFWAWYYPVHWDEVFRSRLRTSFLISLVSFAETQLDRVCRDTAIIVRSELARDDLKGSVMETSRKFLQVFGEFAKPSGPEWELIIRIYDVRNVLVHRNGCISGYHHEKRLFQFLNDQSGLSQTYGFVKMEKEFCALCLDSIESFSRVLRDELKDLCERVKRSESK